MQPLYVTKNMTAASSSGIGTVSSAGTLTINTSNFDTGHRVTIWSTGATLASVTFKVTGTRDGGSGVITESLTGPTSNAAVTTAQDFLSVTSVSISSVMTNQATVGISSIGGTPWKIVDTDKNPVNVGLSVLSSTAVTWTVDYTMEDPTGTFANPNATTPTIFTYATSTGAANTSLTVLTAPVAALRLTLSASGTATFVVIQSG